MLQSPIMAVAAAARKRKAKRVANKRTTHPSPKKRRDHDVLCKTSTRSLVLVASDVHIA